MGWKKRFKKVVKKVGVTGSRILTVAAPLIGAAVAGPLGAAAGTAIGAAAARAGGGGSTRIKRALMIGGAITGATGLGALIGGTGLTGSILKLFGGGGPAVNEAGATQEQQEGADAVDARMRDSGGVDVESPGAKAAYGGILNDVVGAVKERLGLGTPTDSTTMTPSSDMSGAMEASGAASGAGIGAGVVGKIKGVVSKIPNWAVVGIPLVIVGYFWWRSRRRKGA